MTERGLPNKRADSSGRDAHHILNGNVCGTLTQNTVSLLEPLFLAVIVAQRCVAQKRIGARTPHDVFAYMTCSDVWTSVWLCPFAAKDSSGLYGLRSARVFRSPFD